MSTSKLSVMDEKPHSEYIYRNLAQFATAATAVHVSWTYDNPNDSLAGWLASTMPTILTGFMLFGLFLSAACDASDTQFFSLTPTDTESGHKGKPFRTSSDPAREDRHLFYAQVVAFAAGFGISVDLVYRWYLICLHIWGSLAEDARNGFVLSMAILATFLPLGFLMFLTWMPLWYLLRARRSFDNKLNTRTPEDGDAGSRAKLGTLFAAAEAYEKDLESQTERSQPKVEAMGEFLGVLRKWQTSDPWTGLRAEPLLS